MPMEDGAKVKVKVKESVVTCKSQSENALTLLQLSFEKLKEEEKMQDIFK